MTAGIVYVAYGEPALNECAMAIAALRHCTSLPIATIGAEPVVRNPHGVTHVSFDNPGWGARWAKLMIDQLSPFDDTIYMDADTRARSSPALLLGYLDDGYDLVIAPSGNQGMKALEHVERQEREDTFDEFGFTPVQLQAGMFAFRKNARTRVFFEAWRSAWQMTPEPTQDQAALLRALRTTPLRLWLTSTAMSEQLIGHLWGRLH